MNHQASREEKISIAIDIAIKLSVLGLVIYVSYLIAKPFLGVIVWGIIIAVALSPVVNKLETYFGHRKRIILLLAGLMISMLIIPAYMLSGTMIKTSKTLEHTIAESNLTIPPPTQHVKEWPIIGESIYTFWDTASHSLKEALTPYSKEIKKFVQYILSALRSGFSTILIFIGAIVVATAFLLHKKNAVTFYHRVLYRLVGDNADEWANISTLTIRSVVIGVLGVAVIQGVLAFIGMGIMGIPLSIVWAILIVFLGIMQLPALIVIVPVIVYAFSQGSGISEIIFTIYMLFVGASDNIMKPMLMGRGIDIPMLVILIGAIGGMILMGLIGLFIGSVIFALAYKLLELWLLES